MPLEIGVAKLNLFEREDGENCFLIECSMFVFLGVLSSALAFSRSCRSFCVKLFTRIVVSGSSLSSVYSTTSLLITIRYAY